MAVSTRDDERAGTVRDRERDARIARGRAKVTGGGGGATGGATPPPGTDRPVLAVNPIGCEAHGLCAELLPEMITLDEWGYPILAPGGVPPHLIAHAKRAVSACPTLALHLRRGQVR